MPATSAARIDPSADDKRDVAVHPGGDDVTEFRVDRGVAARPEGRHVAESSLECGDDGRRTALGDGDGDVRPRRLAGGAEPSSVERRGHGEDAVLEGERDVEVLEAGLAAGGPLDDVGLDVAGPLGGDDDITDAVRHRDFPTSVAEYERSTTSVVSSFDENPRARHPARAPSTATPLAPTNDRRFIATGYTRRYIIYMIGFVALSRRAVARQRLHPGTAGAGVDRTDGYSETGAMG